MAKDKIYTQYGALPFTRQNGVLRVMLITTRETRSWLIPKGWPEKGMAPHELAAHEAFEEAGITGSVSTQPMGSFDYLKRIEGKPPKRCRIVVFGLEVATELDHWPEKSERRREWLLPAEAAERIEHPQLASLILAFAEPQKSTRRRA